jgi:hypothetical protein
MPRLLSSSFLSPRRHRTTVLAAVARARGTARARRRRWSAGSRTTSAPFDGHAAKRGRRRAEQQPEDGNVNRGYGQAISSVPFFAQAHWCDMEGEVLRVDLGFSYRIRDGLHQIHAGR